MTSVGDVVVRKKNDKNKPSGTSRFESLCEPGLYRITRKVGENTYEIASLDGTPVVNMKGEPTAIPAKHLIKCDMPELELEVDGPLPRRLEVQGRRDHNKWYKGTLERFGADGRAFIRFDGEPERRYVDLTKEIYRWLIAGEEEARPVVPLLG